MMQNKTYLYSRVLRDKSGNKSHSNQLLNWVIKLGILTQTLREQLTLWRDRNFQFFSFFRPLSHRGMSSSCCGVTESYISLLSFSPHQMECSFLHALIPSSTSIPLILAYKTNNKLNNNDNEITN